MREFTPPRWLRGGHRMTIYAWGRPRAFEGLPPAVPRYFDVEPGTRVLAHCHWQADPPARPTLVVLHGLEGSSHAHYMRGVADKACRRGFNVVRLNQRNCGGTEHLSPGLYHSGLTGDVRAVITELAAADRLPSIIGSTQPNAHESLSLARAAVVGFERPGSERPAFGDDAARNLRFH